MKILLLNTTHLSFDDRVFYHQAISLKTKGYDIQITSTCEDVTETIDGIVIQSYDHRKLNHKEKTLQLCSSVRESKADVIIADSPKAVIAASKCRVKKNIAIIYDITEWYPSKKYLRDVEGWKKLFKATMQAFYNLYAASRTDFFIFGETDKSLPFRLFFPLKPFIFLPYYPETSYLKKYTFDKIETDFKISYSGLMTEEKGLFTAIEVVRKAALLRTDINFHLQLTGKFPDKENRIRYEKAISSIPENMHIVFKDFQPFKEYCNAIGNTHLFLDLRKIDFENNRCLPIKLFYYFACGKPVIYSSLNAIRTYFPEINFGYLANPENSDHIAELIINYIENPDIYKLHCDNSAHLSNRYTWKCIEPNLLNLIKKIKPIFG